MKFFTENGSKVFVITNWKSRNSEADAMLRMPLTGPQKKVYIDLKDKGEDETVIYNTLFPSPPEERKRTIQIEVDDLTKPQMITQINRELGLSLESLDRMKVDDLKEMLLALANKAR